MKVGPAINKALHELFKKYDDLLILGEDILDPYGGAFKITKGLSSNFPDRTFTTPISEAGIVGVATGLALGGFKPIVEIMFGDFITLAFDQILNHASKYPQMFKGKACPIVIRTPMGGRRGYGPTHSQTLEKHFIGIPGLNTIAINEFMDIKKCYDYAINQESPTLIIENKLLYNKENIPIYDSTFLDQYECFIEFKDENMHHVYFDRSQETDVVIITYGGMTEITIEAALKLILEFEIFSEIFILTDLKEPLAKSIIDTVKKTNVLATIEEGPSILPIGNHFLAQIFKNDKIEILYIPITGADFIIPAAKHLENSVLPSKDFIVGEIKTALANKL